MNDDPWNFYNPRILELLNKIWCKCHRFLYKMSLLTGISFKWKAMELLPSEPEPSSIQATLFWSKNMDFSSKMDGFINKKMMVLHKNLSISNHFSMIQLLPRVSLTIQVFFFWDQLICMYPSQEKFPELLECCSKYGGILQP